MSAFTPQQQLDYAERWSQRKGPGVEAGAELGSKESPETPSKNSEPHQYSLDGKHLQGCGIVLFVRVAGTEPVFITNAPSATKDDIEQAIRFLRVLQEQAE